MDYFQVEFEFCQFLCDIVGGANLEVEMYFPPEFSYMSLCRIRIVARELLFL